VFIELEPVQPFLRLHLETMQKGREQADSVRAHYYRTSDCRVLATCLILFLISNLGSILLLLSGFLAALVGNGIVQSVVAAE
jgi:hypothetical protein